jgi:MFS family permease
MSRLLDASTEALREPLFRLVFIGQSVSSFGGGLMPVALTFAVLARFHSATALGDVLGAQTIASILLYITGGVAGDRFPRRVVMVVMDSARCAGEVSLGLVLLSPHPALGVVCALNALQGVAGGIFAPSAMGMVPEVVSEEHLQSANALMSMTSSITSVVAPAVAGVMVATIGGGWAILINGASFGVNAIVLTRLPRSLSVPDRTASALAQLRDGWRTFVSMRWFVEVVLSGTAFNYFTGLYYTLAPVIAKRALGGASTWAAVAVAGAIGSIIGGLSIMRVRPRHPLRVAMTVMLPWSLMPLGFALHLPVAVLCGFAVVVYMGVIGFDSLYYTAIQRAVPGETLSRVMSYEYFFASLAFPAGLISAGPLAAAIGIRTVLAVAAVGALAITAVTIFAPGVWRFEALPTTPLESPAAPAEADG